MTVRILPRGWPARGASGRTTKFRPPTGRPGIVARTELVDRLRASPSVISVVAPPGYGKTTLLSQWASAQGRRDVAWVSVDRSDNDTSVLLTNAALALDKVEPIDGGVFRTLASPGAATAANAIARIASTLASRSEPVRLVFDDARAARQPGVPAMRSPSWPCASPRDPQLAIATRDAPPLQTALLRSRREMVEIGVGDLAMNEQEARACLEVRGVTLDARACPKLVRQDRGLARGAVPRRARHRRRGHRAPTPWSFTGDHRLMASYLRSEFLSPTVRPDMVSFLTRTAVLDRLSGPVCRRGAGRDGVGGGPGGAGVVEPSARSARSSSSVVSLPSPLPRAAAARAGRSAARPGS